MRLGLIAGTILQGSEEFRTAKREIVGTPFGTVPVYVTAEVAYLPRHEVYENRYILPHKINHPANLWALKELGLSEVVGLNSTGSLRGSLPPGSIVVPDDFIALTNVPTVALERQLHVTPTISARLRQALVQAAQGANIPVVERGIYWQTSGPRLETKAEIRFLANFADLVGMTMGSEVTVAVELGLEYAALCSVDNYGHGLCETPLTEDQIKAGAQANRERMMAVVRELLRMEAEGR